MRFPRRLLSSLALLLILVASPFTSTPSSAQTTLVAPTFSVQRGFYSSPFSLTLSSPGGGTIRYTLDGSAPSATKGTVYSGAIGVSTTTVVRAIAYTSNTNVSPVATSTYLFLADVRNQSDTPLPGWPDHFAADDTSGTYPADYAMDPEVWDHTNNSSKYEAVMKSLPSISMVTDLPNLWNPASGIYYNPSAKEPFDTDPLGNKWERPISLEWINPDGSTGFAVTGGARINGQASRRPQRQPKKNFRVYFKAAYGTPKLDFKLFDHDDAVSKFDRIILRNGGNRSWSYFDRDQRKNADYVNDEWSRRAWLQMGNIAPHGTYAHLYINGLYWGLYNVTERIDEKFVQAYMGGNELDYGTIEADEDYGDIPVGDQLDTEQAWQSLLKDVDGTAPITDTAKYLTIAQKVDVVNLADYFIHVHYIAKTDWPHHNWNAFWKRTGPDKRFKFIPWDNDSGFNNVNENTTLMEDVKGANDAPSRIFLRLMTNPEFQQVVADRLYKHVIDPTGALTPTRCSAIYTQLTNIIDQAVIGESARWGDYARDKYPVTNDAPKGFPAYLYSRDLPDAYADPTNAVDDKTQQTWLDVKNEKLTNYCPKRSGVLQQQYLTNGWYQTAVKPPLFSQFGGAVPANYHLSISNSPNGNVGTIYYTTDETDPRAQFGAVAPGAQNGGNLANVTISTVTHVKARVLNGTTWSPLAEYSFYPPQPFENLVINEVHYSPTSPTVGLNPDDYEFIELYNKGNVPLRLDDVSFARGVSYHFPHNTTIGAGKFLVLASKNTDFTTLYKFSAFGDFRGNLSNVGEALQLIDAVGNQIDFVDYLPIAPWPAAASGTGKSLSLDSPTSDNSLAVNWFASTQLNGTPGAPNGAAPSIDGRLGPIAIDFGAQHINEPSATRVITLTNAGTTALQVNNVTISGDYAQTNNCPAGLGPDASCAFTLMFTPTALGTRSGTLSVATNMAGGPLTASLTGVGDELPRIMEIAPNALSFAEQALTTTSTPQQVLLNNTGPAPITINSITTSGDFVHATTCDATLVAGSSCVISVSFAPTALGARTGALTVSSNADAGDLTVALDGTGVPLPRLLAISTDTLDFPHQLVGSSSPVQDVTVSNVGPAPVAISGVSVTGDYAQTNDCPASLAPGASCTISTTFTPTGGDLRSGTLTVASDADGGTLSVALSGVGTTSQSLMLSTSSLHFGAERVGTRGETKSLTITSNGTEAVTGMALSVSGPFMLNSDCPTSLSPGEGCTVSLTFSPSAEGEQTGTLTITSSASSIAQTVELSGTGTGDGVSKSYTLYLPVVRH